MARDSAILDTVDERGAPRAARSFVSWGLGLLAMMAVMGGGLTAVSSLKSGKDATEELHTAADFAAAGDRRTAILQIKSLLVRDPDHLEARTELARLYLAFEHGPLAKKELERVRNTRNWDAAHEYLWQRAALYSAEFDEVVAHYAERSGKLSPDERALLARAHLGQGAIDQARAGFRAVLNLEPGHVDALVGIAELALAEGNLPVAGERVSHAIAVDRQSAQAWMVRGKLEVARNRFAEAEAAFRKAAELNPDSARAPIALARILLSQGRVEETDTVLARVEAVHLRSPAVVLLRTVAAIVQHKLPEASRLSAILLTALPKDPQAMLLAASVAYREGRYLEAQTLLESVVRVAPGSTRARELLAATQLALGNAAAVSAILAPVRKSDPFNPVVLTLLAEAQLMKGGTASARPLLEQAMKAMAPHSAALVRTRMALRELANGAPQAAARELAQAQRLDPSSETTSLISAFVKLQEGNAAQAAELAERASKGHSGRPAAVAINVKGVSLEKAGRMDEARAAYLQAAQLDPSYAHPTLNLARMARALQDREAEQQVLTQFLERMPTQPDVMVALARTAFEAGDETESLRILERARKANAEHVGVREALVKLHLKARRLPLARAVAEELLAVGGAKSSVVALVAQVRFVSGDRVGALALLREGRASAPKDVQLGLVSANMYALAGDRRTARAIYDDLVSRHPDAVALLLERGRYALSVGDFDGAATDATQILTGLPQAVEGHLLLGDVAVARRDYPSAIAHFSRAVPLDATGLASIKVGHAHRLAGEVVAAEAAFRERLKHAPADKRARLSLAQLLEQAGRLGDATAVYEAVLKTAPDDVGALNNLALLLQAQGRVEDALALSARAYENAGDIPAVGDTHGWLLVAAGRATEAIPILSAAVRSAPDLAQARYHLGAALTQAGRNEEAIDALRSALSRGLTVDADPAAELLARLRRN